MTAQVPPSHSIRQQETKQQHEERMKWWREARFGMFVHWGLYSALAGNWNNERVTKPGTAEWIQNTVQTDTDTYAEQALAKFNPTENFAQQWAQLAKDAGCKYVVFTTKHHEGFALHNSEISDYCAGKKLNRDLVKEITEALRAQGLRVGFYHSVIDWHHPQYNYHLSKQIPHPFRDITTDNNDRDHQKYLDYLHAQVKELVTNYGHLDVFWYDFSSPDFQGQEAWRAFDLIQLVDSHQPGIIQNNRLFHCHEAGWTDSTDLDAVAFNLDTNYGDFISPEQYVPTDANTVIDWESCMTMNHTWGYSDYDHNWKQPQEIIHHLIDAASRGGNLLLNVGPKGDGSIPEKSADIMRGVGAWLKTNGQSIYATIASPFKNHPWGAATQKQNTLYLHITNWPADNQLNIPITNQIISAKYLASPETPITFTATEQGQTLTLPQQSIDKIATVIELQLDAPPNTL
ncbi:alpha-L-fucosidase [Planctomycetota bacterium]|nr:alpha-L-fucosidase [Planctomycetota bacterium]